MYYVSLHFVCGLDSRTMLVISIIIFMIASMCHGQDYDYSDHDSDLSYFHHDYHTIVLLIVSVMTVITVMVVF